MTRRKIAPSFALLFLLAGCNGGRKPDPVRSESGVRTVEVRARVKAVIGGNRKAVISAGRDQRVAIGTTFAIYRKGEMIGRVQVTGTWPAECGGHIVSSRKPIRTGDEAVASVAIDTPEKAKVDPRTMPSVTRKKPGTIHASVIAVREKANRLVIDAGSRQGVKPGKVFYIYRGDTYVGRVRITLVKPGMAGAEIVEQRVKIGVDCRVLYDPEEELREAGRFGPKPKTGDLEAQIRGLEARIADPKTSPEDRKAAREVLVRLRKQRRGE